MTKKQLTSLSIQTSTQAELAKAISHSNGCLLIHDLPKAPFEPIQDLLQNSAATTTRLNQAYPKTLLYNDALDKVDRKRSLDLSPDRLAVISQTDPELVKEQVLQPSLDFYKNLQEIVQDILLPALAQAIGSEDLLQDVAYNYRMLDYYPALANTSASALPPCKEHRDFGYMTIIQATHPGLQVCLEGNGQNKWVELPPIPQGSAMMMFGWCTHVRSNGRIPGVLHRVRQHPCTETNSRIAAVLFAAPQRTDTQLEPSLASPEEVCLYKTPTVGDLNQKLVDCKLEKSVFRWLMEGGNAASNKATKPTPLWKKLLGPRPNKASSKAIPTKLSSSAQVR